MLNRAPGTCLGLFFFPYTEGIFIFPQLRALWQHRVNSPNLPSLSAGVSPLTKTLRCASTGSEHEIKNVFTLLVCFISSIDFLIERPQDLCYRAEQLCKKSSRVPEAFPMCPTGKNPRAGRAKSWFQALCREGSLVLCVHREMWLFLSLPGAWSSLGQWKIHGRIWKRWIKLSLPKFPWYCVHALLVHH